MSDMNRSLYNICMIWKITFVRTILRNANSSIKLYIIIKLINTYMIFIYQLFSIYIRLMIQSFAHFTSRYLFHNLS